MKLNETLRRIAAGMLCLLLCAAGLAQPASAASMGYIPGFDPNKNCVITLDYGIEGLTIQAYKVADVGANVKFTPAAPLGPHIPAGVDLNKLTTSGWWDLGKALEEAVLLNSSIHPAATQVTGAPNGTVTFTLKPGLYLIMSQRYVADKPDDKGNQVYTTTPYLVCLPYREVEGTGAVTWNWNVHSSVSGKVYGEKLTEIGIQVQKIWLDENGNKLDNHPSSVTFELWKSKDGTTTQEKDRTITLPQNGSWQGWWDGLSNEYTWIVKEVPVAGYTTEKSFAEIRTVTIPTHLPIKRSQ